MVVNKKQTVIFDKKSFLILRKDFFYILHTICYRLVWLSLAIVLYMRRKEKYIALFSSSWWSHHVS